MIGRDTWLVEYILECSYECGYSSFYQQRGEEYTGVYLMPYISKLDIS